ncbi:MAG TPA: hypothetical protein DIT04_08085 [Dysgonomonas sp.]|nr:hypothetical protein [Dysgonomonas sp.]
MKKHLFLSVFGLAILFFSCDKKLQLSEEQKVNDFLYLYETMQANYPYFGKAKRKSGVDWLGKKEEYIQRVRSTASDSVYLHTLIDILRELKDGHTDLSPTLMYEGFLTGYKQIAIDIPRYSAWVETLEESIPQVEYWSEMMKPKPKTENDTSITENSSREISQYSDTIMADKGIAIMRIPSIAMELIEQDKPKIEKFIDNLKGVKNLIIDIQGNGGGSTSYWSDMIVARLIKDTIVSPVYYGIKGGELNRKYYEGDFTTKKKLDKDNPFYSKIHSDLLDGSYYFIEEADSVPPNNPVAFDGDIYLLVDKRVFSSAEGFAYFCKNTGWAKVAGQTTAGDGVGSVPVLALLPESHILVRFPVTAGLNADGSINSEAGTTPDIIIEGENKEERLDNLIKMLAQ